MNFVPVSVLLFCECIWDWTWTATKMRESTNNKKREILETGNAIFSRLVCFGLFPAVALDLRPHLSSAQWQRH